MLLRRADRRTSAGFTLLEVLIVLAVIVMITGIGVSSISSIGPTQMRTQANKLASAIRFAYNRSVVHGLYLRMVLDLDEESYMVEASDSPIFISKTKLDQNKRDQLAEEKAEKEAKEDEEALKEGRSLPKRQRFMADGVIEKVVLEKGVALDGVMTSAQDEIYQKGKAYIHFFPNGYVEPSLIHLTDGQGTYTTLTVNPLTGKVTRSPGKVDPSRDFGEPDKVEEEGR